MTCLKIAQQQRGCSDVILDGFQCCLCQALWHARLMEAMQCVSSHCPEGGVPSGTVRRRCCCWVEMLVGGGGNGYPAGEDRSWRNWLGGGLLGSDGIVDDAVSDKLESGCELTQVSLSSSFVQVGTYTLASC